MRLCLGEEGEESSFNSMSLAAVAGILYKKLSETNKLTDS